MEVVWSVTDPPLKALRRVIPPLRIGNVSLDLASLVLLVILFVLMDGPTRFSEFKQLVPDLSDRPAEGTREPHGEPQRRPSLAALR